MDTTAKSHLINLLRGRKTRTVIIYSVYGLKPRRSFLVVNFHSISFH